MDEIRLLLPAVAALYLYESAVHPPRGRSVFHGGAGGRLRVDPGRRASGEPRGVWRLGPLMPPFGRVFIVPDEPFETLPGAGRAHEHDGAARTVTAPARVGADVVLPGGARCRFPTAREAEEWASAFSASAHSAAGRSDEPFRGVLKERARLDGIREAADRAERAARPFRVLCTLQFLLIFVPASTFAILRGFQGFGLLWVASMLLLHVVTVAWVFRARPRDAGGWGERLMFASSPVMSVRAPDLLFRGALARFDPLAVALALGDPESVRTLARLTAVSLRIAAERAAGEPLLESALAARSWAFERLMRAAGLSPGRLGMAPIPHDATAHTYCPACWVAYAVDEGDCRECGARLLRFEPDALEREARERRRLQDRQARIER